MSTGKLPRRLATSSRCMAKIVILAVLTVSTFGKHEQYKGWKSYFIVATTNAQVQQLYELVEKLDLDFLSPILLNREAVVLVQPKHNTEFLNIIKKMGIKQWTHVADIKTALDHDDEVMDTWSRCTGRTNFNQYPYNSYQRLESIYDYMAYITNEYPNTVRMRVPEFSFQRRAIRYLKISTTNFLNESKPIIFINGGIHAREWIAPATVVYVIRKLTEDLTEPNLLNNFDWILLPVLNPDGYEFTFIRDRLWRKNRSITSYSNRRCLGVDGNRNYDIFWRTAGTSNNPCSDTYGGQKAFSEMETRVIRDILNENIDRLALYIDMHSYGSMVMYPWAYDGSLSNYSKVLHSVGTAMANIMDQYTSGNFPHYAVGNSARMLNYKASGTAKDYAHFIGVPLSYAIELPGLSNGTAGFHLEPKFIESICKATWAGIAVGAQRAKKKCRSGLKLR